MRTRSQSKAACTEAAAPSPPSSEPGEPTVSFFLEDLPPELIELVRATERAEQAACAREIEGVDELEEEEEALLLEQRKANRERQRQHYKERMAKEKKQQNRMYRRH